VTWNVVLVFVHLLAACVWVGGFVAIALIDRGARQALILRASIGTLTLALLGLGVVLAA
jgi:uncharacterized membrane protein